MIVLGDGFAELQAFEATDLIGRGDLVASYEMQSLFARLGYRRLDLVFADRADGLDPSGRSLRRNLVVIGGDDANTVTRRCLSNMNVGYRLVRSDGVNPRLLGAQSDAMAQQRMQPLIQDGKVELDYGVIIRARSPFDHDGSTAPVVDDGNRVILFYGCYGYGTLAAALYSQTKEFLSMVENSDDDIECVVACRVHAQTPQAISVAYFSAQPYGSLYVRSHPGDREVTGAE